MANPDLTSTKKYRRSTTISVEFPTLPSLSATPRRVDLYQKQYHHDVLVMEFAIPSTLWASTIKTGVPMVFKWSQGVTSNEWVGYVSYISTQHKVGREKIMEVHCIAASYPLKQRITKVFKNKTIPQAVEELVRSHGLNFIGDGHSRVFDQLVLSGHSIWEWIQEQAKRIGYVVIVEGTNFYFKRLDAVLDFKSSSVPVMSYSNSDLTMNSQVFDRTLDYLQVLQGENVEGQAHSRSNKIVGGVDPITAKAFSSKQSPKKSGKALRTSDNDVLFDEYSTSQVVNSHEGAVTAATGAATLGRMTIPAKISGQGDGRIKPFNPVFIMGTGDATDGYWIVKEAHHMFQKIGDYQLEALIATDGLGGGKVSSFRTTPDSIVGTVDLKASLASPKMVKAGRHGTRLEHKSLVLVEHAQGYNRTPTKWKTSPTPGRK